MGECSMKNRLSFWLIRHAQSEANAGLKTSDPISTPLTEKGRKQAYELAQSLQEPPRLIVTSPYTRAWRTAEPVWERFPKTPVVTWPIQEFTYLCPTLYQNTTQAERRPFVQSFWGKADPTYCDGVGAESFFQFFERVKQAEKRMKDLAISFENTGKILLFGHGQFIRTLLFLWLTQKQEIDSEAMSHMGSFIQAFYVPNASIIKSCFFEESEVHFSTVITSHLSEDVRT